MYWKRHRWVEPERLEVETASQLARSLGVPEVIAAVLLRRGCGEIEAAQKFLHPQLSHLKPPQSLKGFEPGVARICLALERGETVALYGDYDADGVTAISLLARFLGSIGLKTIPFVPRRFREGYGLHKETISRFVERGATLLITADCGISNGAEIEHARALGLDVIVIDHHHIPPAMPDATCVINPLQPDCAYAYKGLSSVGLAFMLATGVRAALRDRGRWSDAAVPSLRPYLALVAIGTIADVSPLDGENRILVAEGLKAIAESVWPGVRALCRVARIDELLPTGAVDARDVAFKLSPRLNAAGRLDDAIVSVNLLTTDDPREAEALAAALDQANRDRQAIEATIVDEAVAEAERQVADGRNAIVVWREGWHAGVVGIVAARLVERFYKPTFVAAIIANDVTARGSVRSTAGFHAAKGLEQCADLLVAHGGHAAAAGFSIHREMLPRFAVRIDEIAAAAAGTHADGELPILRIDGELPLDLVTPALVSELARLKPFGMGNPEPCFVARGVEVVACSMSTWGHQNLTLRQGGSVLRATGFRMGPPTVTRGERIDVAFSIRSAREVRLRDLPRRREP